MYDLELLIFLRYPKYVFVHAVTRVTGDAVELALQLPHEGFVSLEAGRLVPDIKLATESKVQVCPFRISQIDSALLEMLRQFNAAMLILMNPFF